MKFTNMQDVLKSEWKVIELDGKKLKLSQINALSNLYEMAKTKNIEDPMKLAVDTWREEHFIEDNSWVKKIDKELFETEKEIFSVGNWNGDDYKEEDLKSIVNNFNKFKVKVPLKIDSVKVSKEEAHGGIPAVGWIKQLSLEGEKLIATISNIPKKIKELIDMKAYSQVSCEIGWNWKINNEVADKLLVGVALLGVEQPGVQNLDDFADFYTIKNTGVIKTYNKKGGPKMDELELIKKEKEELKKYTADVEKEVQALKQYKEKVEAEKVETKKASIKSFVEDAIKGGRILPKFSDNIEKLLIDLDDKNSDMLKQYITESKVINFDSKTENVDVKKDSVPTRESITEEAKKYATENKISYIDAINTLVKKYKEVL